MDAVVVAGPARVWAWSDIYLYYSASDTLVGITTGEADMCDFVTLLPDPGCPERFDFAIFDCLMTGCNLIKPGTG